MAAASRPLFFEGLRTAAGALPEGLVRLGPPAADADLLAVERHLGRRLPHELVELLRSFDGADLFHESIVVCGAGRESFRALVDANPAGAAELVIGEGVAGDRYVLAPDDEGAERVWQLRAETDERWLAGSSFARWLDAVLAAEPVLYDSDGEFLLAAFEEDGEELAPPFALRRAERALRKDPGSALYHHDLAVAQRRLGRLPRAREAFAKASSLDPSNPWPWFDLGRCALELADPTEAAAAFRQAALSAPAPAERARFLAWSARASLEAGDRAGATAARDEALRHHAELPAELRRAALAAAGGDEPAARIEAEALAGVFEPGALERRRLPILGEPARPAAARPEAAARPAASPRPADAVRSTKRPAPRPPSRSKKRRRG